MSFFSTAWDPALIVAQIVVVQSAFYVTAATVAVSWSAMLRESSTLAQLLDYRHVGFSDAYLFGTSIAFALAGIVSAFVLLVVVERAKKCWDFTLTTALVHIVAVCAYGGFPASFSWWAVHIVCFVVMNFLGEFMCMKRELRLIPLSQL